MIDLEGVVRLVQEELARASDAEKASGMQAYMKTDMPFYGVQKPRREPIAQRVFAEFAPGDREEYQALVATLWGLSHREEKYLALAVAGHFRRFVVPGSLSLYRRLITEGAWWDFVDEVATRMIGRLVVTHPDETWAEVDQWIGSEDLWLRRAAIICQVGAKEKTDPNRLFGFCLAQADEPEFFIRKAIGWALRSYARTAPTKVAHFVLAHRDRLSPLSYREATKHIGELIR